jgi:hypothetical protein
LINQQRQIADESRVLSKAERRTRKRRNTLKGSVQAGPHREQRRFLNVLRYLSNELEASLVCFGVSEAVDAIRGDVQLARRLDEHHLPNWRDDAEFSDMIQTLIAAMPLEKKSNLKKIAKADAGADR